MGATSSARQRASSVRHTRAVQRDRQTQPTVAPPAPPVEAWLRELIHPATLAQVAAYQRLGLRERILTLPVMVALVLSLVWRQLGSVSEAVRVLRQEGLLWAGPTAVSQQAVSERLRRFPPELFERVLLEVLPQAQARWQARQRPLPPLPRRLQGRFAAVLALDGSTLDAVLHKVGLLRGQPGAALGGRIAALLDVLSALPRQVWYEADPRASDQRFWDRALTAAPRGSLLLFDGGFLNYARYDALAEAGVWFLTRAGTTMAYRVTRVLQDTAALRDRLVVVGSRAGHRCARPLRLIEVRVGQGWHRYLTNALDPALLPAEEARAVYALRWGVEEAFLVAKRLLGLAYLWTGAANGVLTQVWATWLLYAALTDLCDAVADALHLPAERLSTELTYRALYHFTQAFHRGEAHDVVAYLAANATALGLVKRSRRAPPAPLTPPDDPYLVTVALRVACGPPQSPPTRTGTQSAAADFVAAAPSRDFNPGATHVHYRLSPIAYRPHAPRPHILPRPFARSPFRRFSPSPTASAPVPARAPARPTGPRCRPAWWRSGSCCSPTSRSGRDWSSHQPCG